MLKKLEKTWNIKNLSPSSETSQDVRVKLPMIETRTGDVLRVSASGNVIDTVRTDPRLVPNHRVGMSVDGSETFI